MSVQPPAAPHRVAIADVDIPFWRMVAIIIKWTFAAIPAMITAPEARDPDLLKKLDAVAGRVLRG